MAYKDPSKIKENYLKNRVDTLARKKARYYSDPEKYRAYSRAYYAKNRDKCRETNELWRRANWEKVLADTKIHCATRRARKKNSIPDDFDESEVRKFYAMAESLTKLTGIQFVVDHIRPISRGGLHHQGNLQVITFLDNARKGVKYPFHVEPSFSPS